MIRASDLAGKRVRTEDGDVLGHVFEIHVKNSEVTELVYGVRGFFQRLAGAGSGRGVDWAHVIRMTQQEIVVADPRVEKK